MEIFIKFLIAFAVGGALCTLGQILILKTNWTTARILASFVTLGVILQAVTLFEPIKRVAGAGITVPITGFGGTLAKGAMDAVKENGFLGILTGGLTAVAAGLAVAVTFAFLVSMVAKSRSK